MREHIARLEMRVKELENPEQSAPSMTLFDPHAISPYYSESSSSSSYDSPGKLSYSASASPTPFPLSEQEHRRSAILSPLSLEAPEVDPRAWDQLNFSVSVSSVQPPPRSVLIILPPGLGVRFGGQFIQRYGGPSSRSHSVSIPLVFRPSNRSLISSVPS